MAKKIKDQNADAETAEKKYIFRYEFEIIGVKNAYQGIRNISVEADTEEEGLEVAMELVKKEIPNNWSPIYTGKCAKKSKGK